MIFDIHIRIDESLEVITISGAEYYKGDKGDDFTYEDFTPEQIEGLKQPAIDAAEEVEALIEVIEGNELSRISAENGRVQAETGRAIAENDRETNELARSQSETTRGQNETTRQQAEITREANEGERITAESERKTAEELRVIAEQNRAAELSSKANHGYTTNPKTLKEVEDSLVQLAGDVSELEIKDAVQGAKIKGIENVLSTANLNQSAQLSVSGISPLSLPKNAANGGMQVQLFGQSAQNLVMNGDLRNGTTGWAAGSSTNSVTNGVLTNTGNGASSSCYVYASFGTAIVGNKYYASAKVRVKTSLCTYLALSLGDTVNDVTSPATDNSYTINGITTASTTYNLAVIHHNYSSAADANGASIEVDNVMVINLTATFGAGNEPTKEQCDLLFANYFEGSQNVLGTGRIRSVGKNLFKFNKSDSVRTISGKEYLESYFHIPFYSIYNESCNNGIYIYSSSSGIKKIADIKFQANTQYTIKAHSISGLGSVYYNIIFIFYTDGTSSSAINNMLITSTAGKTIQYIGFGNYGTGGYYALFEIASIIVERGSTATPYEPYRQSILQLTTPELRSNGIIKDEIRKGTNGYELVKRVGVGTLTEKITNAADREFSSDTGFWTLNPTYCEITGGNLTLTNTANGTGLIKTGFLTIGKRYKVTLTDVVVTEGYISFGGSFLEAHLININTAIIERTSIASETTFYLVGYDNLTCSIGGISIKELDEADGAAASSIFTEIGSKVRYTLATPVITAISHAGLLNSNSNGTAYFEPIIADAGVYGSNLSVQLTDYPIASFESIRKYANGTYTELNIATAVIAGNGLSFTHPDLASGDLVMFTYAYNKESVGRSMTLTHYDNRYVKVDTANGKTYRIDFVVTNGVVVPTATEV